MTWDSTKLANITIFLNKKRIKLNKIRLPIAYIIYHNSSSSIPTHNSTMGMISEGLKKMKLASKDIKNGKILSNLKMNDEWLPKVYKNNANNFFSTNSISILMIRRSTLMY